MSIRQSTKPQIIDLAHPVQISESEMVSPMAESDGELHPCLTGIPMWIPMGFPGSTQNLYFEHFHALATKWPQDPRRSIITIFVPWPPNGRRKSILNILEASGHLWGISGTSGRELGGSWEVKGAWGILGCKNVDFKMCL